MSIFGMMTGTMKARKVANCSAKVWQGSVNYLTLAGRNLKWCNSAELLGLAYCLIVFEYATRNLGKSSDHMGAVIVKTSEFLGEILIQVWARQMPMEEIRPLVSEIVSGLPDRYHVWLAEIMDYCKSKGLVPPINPGLLFETAVEYYLEGLGKWYISSFSERLQVKDKKELHNVIVAHIASNA